MLLAIDTATHVMSLALHDGKNLLSEQTWLTPNRHTIELTPAVQTMLRMCEVSVIDLTALAVCTGPGSYTGLRIGVAMAKGMAAVKSLPLIGMTSLDILAAGQPYYQSGAGLIPVVQAGRGRIIINTYRWRKGKWASHAEPRLMDWETLLNSIDGPAQITGEIDDPGMDAIKNAQAKDLPVTIAPPAYRLRRAGFLAEYAWEKLRDAGEDRSAFAPARLLPVYIKSDE